MLVLNLRGGGTGFFSISFRFMWLVLGMLAILCRQCLWKEGRGVQNISPHGLLRRRRRESLGSTVTGIDLGIILPSCHSSLIRCRYAFSDNAPSPMSAGSAIDILSAALPKANITEDGPGWILVAHENGALYSQVFASRHTSQVKGMLFVDGYPSTMIPRIYTPARTFLLLLRGIISPL